MPMVVALERLQAAGPDTFADAQEAALAEVYKYEEVDLEEAFRLRDMVRRAMPSEARAMINLSKGSVPAMISLAASTARPLIARIASISMEGDVRARAVRHAAAIVGGEGT